MAHRSIWRESIGELFLCATRKIDNFGEGGSDVGFQYGFDGMNQGRICHHIQAGSQPIPALQDPRRKWKMHAILNERQDVLGSCKVCLTDYCTTIEQKQLRGSVSERVVKWEDASESNPPYFTKPGWVITITN
ncbi:Fc.00g102600.m01.CDS01 [Cosmosporella sp. VM-42]